MPTPADPSTAPVETPYARRSRRMESARIRFAPIAEILGDGPVACVSRCLPRAYVTLVPTADRARWFWREAPTCGEGCRADHAIFDLDVGATIPLEGPFWAGPNGDQQ